MDFQEDSNVRLRLNAQQSIWPTNSRTLLRFWLRDAISEKSPTAGGNGRGKIILSTESLFDQTTSDPKSKMSSFSPIALVVVAVSTASASAVAGSPVYVGTKSSKRVSTDDIEHSAWDRLLKTYVDSDGMVNYQAWKANRSDIQKLDRYLAELSSAGRTAAASHQSKLAFWINAYNAVTIRGILREYPTTSIRNHTARLFGYNIWNDLKLYVGGAPYSLRQIEHEILRRMSEPRIHFAIVCASISCPRLLGEAYVADRIEKQLAANTKDFFTRSRNFRYDKANKRFYLSSILKWFDDDFGADQASQLRRIAPWLPSAEATAAARRGTVAVSYLDYDWGLNKQ